MKQNKATATIISTTSASSSNIKGKKCPLQPKCKLYLFIFFVNLDGGIFGSACVVYAKMLSIHFSNGFCVFFCINKSNTSALIVLQMLVFWDSGVQSTMFPYFCSLFCCLCVCLLSCLSVFDANFAKRANGYVDIKR